MGRVDAVDAAHRTQAESANVEAQREAQQKKMVMVIWYDQDHDDGEYFQVVAPYYGWFHPKDAPELVECFGVDQKSFQFYDRGLARWVTLSPGSGTRRVIGLEELHYRSLGVREAPGMPIGRGTKRNADGAPVPDWTAPGSSTGGSIPATPQSRGRFLSPAPTLPPETPSSSHTQDFMWPTPSAFPTNMDGEDLFEPLLTALPALFARSADVPGSLSTLGAAPAEQTNAPTLPFGPAPRGPSTTGWPLKYVCDMAAGFDLMQTYEEGPDHLKRPTAFSEVFNVEYKKTTVNDNLRFWRAACDAPEVRARLAKAMLQTILTRWIRIGAGGIPDVAGEVMHGEAVQSGLAEQSEGEDGIEDGDDEGGQDGDDEREADSESISSAGSEYESRPLTQTIIGGGGAPDGQPDVVNAPVSPVIGNVSADEDSEGLPSGSGDNRGGLLWTALRAYGFVDARYVDNVHKGKQRADQPTEIPFAPWALRTSTPAHVPRKPPTVSPFPHPAPITPVPASARRCTSPDGYSSDGPSGTRVIRPLSKRPRIESSPELDSSPALRGIRGAGASHLGHSTLAHGRVAPAMKKRKPDPPSEFLASDIELIPAPLSEDEGGLAPKDQAQADLVEWLRTTDNHSWDNHVTVEEIRNTPKRASRSAKNLLTWIRTVTALMDLGTTDDTAPGRAKNRRITATAVGLFVNRGAEWVNDCVACRRLYTRHKTNPRFIKALEDISDDTFGVSSFRTVLGTIVSQILQETKKPNPLPLHNRTVPGPRSTQHRLHSHPQPGPSSQIQRSRGRKGKASKPPYVEIDEEQGEYGSDDDDYE
ncbi:hypothetical protein LXA43DRAFT_1101367 [Ganoderma leucocontextum]|nr:hypothetical protein LXA43DRAFT_1101367 [Ganoderma leucocontextum]